MATISPGISESLKAYRLQPGRVKIKPEHVSLEAHLGTKENPHAITLQYPYMLARMQSIVGPRMVVEAGRNGILSMVPRSLRDSDKEVIVKANNDARLKKGTIDFLEKPASAEPGTSYKVVLDHVVNRTGHSVIPIMDSMRKLRGIYIHDPQMRIVGHDETPIEQLAEGLRESPKSEEPKGIRYLINVDDETEIKRVLKEEGRTFIPIVNDDMVLQKLAFLQKYDTNFIGMAIGTRGNWRAEIKKWFEKVDTLTLDSSNVWFDDAFKIVRYIKESDELSKKPFGVGNVVSKEAFLEFAEEGADYVIGGMGIGSICQTGDDVEGRGCGRGQMTVAREFAEAREEYFNRTERYVYAIGDGSINSVQTMSVAFGFFDLVMMGSYFNRFLEAAGRKFDSDKNKTHDEGAIRYVETWGEGNPHAGDVAMRGISLTGEPDQNSESIVERYGHVSSAGVFKEGVKGKVIYRGRLKPNIEMDANGLRSNVSNSGMDPEDGESHLEAYRKAAVFEKIDTFTQQDLRPHGLEEIDG